VGTRRAIDGSLSPCNNITLSLDSITLVFRQDLYPVFSKNFLLVIWRLLILLAVVLHGSFSWVSNALAVLLWGCQGQVSLCILELAVAVVAVSFCWWDLGDGARSNCSNRVVLCGGWSQACLTRRARASLAAIWFYSFDTGTLT
jgi:hypothetical protein